MEWRVVFGQTFPPGDDPWEVWCSAIQGMGIVRGTGVTPEAAVDAFLTAWHEQPAASADDTFDFVRVVRVAAQSTLHLDGHWSIEANPGDGTMVTVSAATQADAEQQFISAWNSQRDTSFPDEEFSFARVS